MVQFNTLRLNGFKSFADRTEIEIGEGLTGVVGPNGCGKSNLVEALRWVMGENSSKRMRGGTSMEDVIFNGSSSRSSRNFAEVSLLLDNRGHTAPAEFNQSDEIEVVRRIEKDKGSSYKINGKNVRARDVQMLFADVVVSANSPALVSQGRVTQMITAKPVERRKVLEESAGIAGLYARRHEAELRLKSADTNLARLHDVTGAQENQLQSLKRQSRQASRYKSLSEDIRKTEALLACLELTQAQEALETGRQVLKESESLVASRMLTVTQLTKTQLTQSEVLPDLRENANKASAAWQVQNITLQRLDDEEGQLEDTIGSLKANIENLVQDQKHEKEARLENQALLDRLEQEEKRHHDSQSRYKETIESLKAEKEAKAIAVQELEVQYKTLLKSGAEQSAHKQGLERDIEKYKQQIESCGEKIKSLKETLEVLTSKQGDAGKEQDFQKQIDEYEDKLTQLDAKEKQLREARDGVDARREEMQGEQSALKQSLASIDAEIRTLSSFLENFIDADHIPILESIKAGVGMELALSRALGDTLQASVEDGSAKQWLDGAINVESLAPLPASLKPLLSLVDAPKTLHLALSMVGVADNIEDAQAAFKDLKAGQSIVTVDGEYFRWDGYRMKPEAKDPQSEFLKQKNKLEELESARPPAQEKLNSVIEKIEQLSDSRQETREALKTLHQERDSAQTGLRHAQIGLRNFIEEKSRHQAELVKTKESLSLNETRLQELTEGLNHLEVELSGIVKAIADDDKAHDIDSIKKRLDEEQSAFNDLRVRFEQTQSENKRREIRLHAIVDERLNVNNKLIRAKDQIEKFEKREAETRQKLADIKDRPSEIKGERETILNSITSLQNRKTDLEEALNKAENELRETTIALKEAESLLTTSKEARARAQATLEASEQALKSVRNSIEDQFDISVEDLLHTHKALIRETFGEDGKPQPSHIDELRRSRDKLHLDRERIGPVNLRAEIEAEEIEAELTGLLKEKNELEQAIEELRSGIETLNHEARDRLAIAFERINAYFQSLFVNLFGGGKAYLELVDSDDPLKAGLEIFAQPPGKSLQSLSLLSGGEQTLTSIALIFGMFLTNPSPICVLDEIDAPLDDANVDRVCDLVSDVARRGNTRFLIITHHRLTMARMHRLYGVTMAERGISQLVSVDLQQQLDLLEAGA